MGDVVKFPPDPDMLGITDDIGELTNIKLEEEHVEWIATTGDEDEIDELIEHNAISLFWIGINTLLLNGYPDVPHLLRIIADEVEEQQEGGNK